ncbi:hypothetical protein ABW20_dc0108216 [Dactylellina cionopaga]|nr:hypothetical protein ABW20_dc0108216 [Dactylellina cionopaga]
MPPKKSSKAALASRIASSSSSELDEPPPPPPATTSRKLEVVAATLLESSAIKKGRGRPRKQAAASSITTNDQDDSSTAAPKAGLATGKATKSGGNAARASGAPVVPADVVNKPKADKRKGKSNLTETIDEESEGPAPGRRHVATTKRNTTKTTKPINNRKGTAQQRLEVPETQITQEPPSESDEEMVAESNEEREEKSSSEEFEKKTTRSRKPTSTASANALADELAQLKLRYAKLRHLKMEEAHSIQEERIRTLEEQDNASQRIIDNLKAELKSRSVVFQQLQEKDKRIQELEQQHSVMENKIERLLQDHAILNAKLETARNSAKVSSNSSKNAPAVGPTKEFSQNRDNLYSDLCGLLVVNVKTDEDGGIEYDCLSTGKNGALHFKLQLDAEDEDIEDEDDGPYFTYNPMLEKGRDERLIAILPPIFRDEMNFQRTRGVDFYLQLMRALQAT